MLIVSIPKSASSSLVASLQAVTGYRRNTPKVRKQFLRPAPPPPGYSQLKRFHSEVAEVSDEAVKTLLQPEQITKLHIVPTDNNLRQLRDVPKIVLLRPAEEVVAAYWRGMETATWTTSVKEIARCDSLDQWMQTAADMGLTDELKAFDRRWRAADGNLLVLDYQHLVTDSDAAFAAVFEYFGLDINEMPELAKVNYSKDGGAGTRFYKRMFFSLKRIWARNAGD